MQNSFNIFILILCAGITTSCRTTKGSSMQDVDNSTVHNLKEAYLVISGRGAGFTTFGHSYIVITEKNLSIFQGTAYHYGVNSVDPNLKPDVQYIRDHLTLFLTSGKLNPQPVTKDQPLYLDLQKTPFEQSYFQTIGNPLNTFLYRIQLSSEQVEHLQQVLDEDFEDRRRNPRFDYSLIGFNCVYAAADAINQVLPEGQAIRFDTSPFELRYDRITRFLNIIPIYFLYHMEYERTDLFSRMDSIYLSPAKDQFYRNFQSTRNSFDQFLAAIAQDPYQRVVSKKDREAMLIVLTNPNSAYEGVKVLLEQLYKPIAEQYSREILPVLKSYAVEISCLDLHNARHLRVSPNDRTIRDKSVLLYLLDKESLLKSVFKSPGAFKVENTSDKQILFDLYEKISALARYKISREALKACSSDELQALKAYFSMSLTHQPIFALLETLYFNVKRVSMALDKEQKGIDALDRYILAESQG